jgi:hypothetical protein
MQLLRDNLVRPTTLVRFDFRTDFLQTLWTSSEAEPAPENAPAEKKEEAPAEGEKPAE